MSTTTITTVVFEIGNVLLKWDPEKIFHRLFGRDDFKSHPLKNVIGNEIWLGMDRGTVSKEEAITRFSKSFPEDSAAIAEFIEAVPDSIEPDHAGIECARECKKRGLTILLLSNFPEYAYKKVREKHSFFSIFDGEIISYQVKLLKPEREIYETLISNFHLIPEETLFIDDREENITGAQEVGIRGIHLTKEKNIRQEVERLLSKQ
ncbi:MAG: HAD family phosphatase [Spirochaetes bacterium]|nr:MAG: HAD family phosphatase [Spirochaetota bacterium]